MFDLPYGSLKLDLELREVKSLGHLLSICLRQQHHFSAWLSVAGKVGISVFGFSGRSCGVRSRRQWWILFFIDLIENRGRLVDEKLVLEQESNMFAAG